MALFQLATALLVLVRPSRRLFVACALGNGSFVRLWLLSRTSGFPIGPEPWAAEPVGVVDGIVAAIELGIVIVALHLAWGRIRNSSGCASRWAELGVWLSGSLGFFVLMAAAAHGGQPSSTGPGNEAQGGHLIHAAVFALALGSLPVIRFIGSLVGDGTADA